MYVPASQGASVPVLYKHDSFLFQPLARLERLCVL